MSTFIKEYSEESIFKIKFTGTGITLIAILLLALIALSERVLYDIARVYINSDNVSYFDNLKVITVHAIFIILVLVVSIIINRTIGTLKEKYAIVLIPYFVLSIILALQLALQVTVYFTNHHTTFEFYVVMIALVAVSSYGIYYIQKRFRPELN